MTTLTLTRPDDWHLHFRDGDALPALVPATARWDRRRPRAVRGRGRMRIVMPNLSPPVTTTQQAIAYRERILGHRPAGSGFEPLMVLYLTDTTRPEEIDAAKASGVVFGVKLYPAGATTNSDSGVTDLRHCDDVLARMAEVGLPLLVHGEVTRSDVDIFDRERVFLEETLGPLVERFPNLRIVLEHITTKEAAAFVRSAPAHVGATITPQHLLVNRNAMLVGGIRPHYYCLPILKREEDQGDGLRLRRLLLGTLRSGTLRTGLR